MLRLMSRRAHMQQQQQHDHLAAVEGIAIFREMRACRTERVRASEGRRHELACEIEPPPTQIEWLARRMIFLKNHPPDL